MQFQSEDDPLNRADARVSDSRMENPKYPGLEQCGGEKLT